MQTVSTHLTPQRNDGREVRWHAELAGDHSITWSELAADHPFSERDKTAIARTIERHYIEPLRVGVSTQVASFIERADYPSAYDSFVRLVETSGIGVRVALAISLIPGSSEWLQEISSLGWLLSLGLPPRTDAALTQHHLTGLVTRISAGPAYFATIRNARWAATELYPLPLFDMECLVAAAAMPEPERNKKRQGFVRAVDTLNTALFGPVQLDAKDGIRLGSTPFMRLVRAGKNTQALEELRQQLHDSGLHVRAPGLVSILGRHGYDWATQLGRLADALYEQEPLAKVLESAKEALALGRLCHLP